MLTKSDFMLFLDAPMHLWAKTHDALAEREPSLLVQHILEQGQQVEALARQFLEDHIHSAYDSAKLLWQTAVNDGRYEIRTDGLVYDKAAESYDLYEIKSSSKVKQEHEYDLTFQSLVLEAASMPLRAIYLIHINNDYVLQNDLELDPFFVIEEISAKVEKRREDVRKLREAAWQVSQSPKPLAEFACTHPKTCPCPALCHPDLPEHSIYDLPRIGRKAADLREKGILDIRDIPVNYPLNAKQAQHAQAVQSGEALIDPPAIQTWLDELSYPLHFLDFETFAPAVPLFTGYRPFEQVIFQYSLYTIAQPGADPKHHACLITDRADPEPPLAADLLQHLRPQGSVLVWYAPFERNRNRDLAAHCPDLSEALLAINTCLRDLMTPFSAGWFIHPEFHGSASLKAVLPVLCPDLDYADLKIQDGQEAMLTWYRLQMEDVTPEEQAEVREAMLAYCQRDTYGMVAIWNKLQNL
jgi:hypothetical protein